MDLEPGIAAYVQRLQQELAGSPAPVTPEDRRSWFAIRGDKFRLPLPDNLALIDHFVCAPGREIPIRRYRPHGVALPPLVVYLHGGGWVSGGIATHEGTTSCMASESGAEVISVHYRRPPENPYPAAFDDCLYVARWAVANAARLEMDGGRVVVAGDSAGGNLAAALAIAARDEGEPRLRAQVLIYPVLDANPDRPSYLAKRDPFLLRENMIYYLNAYLQGRLETTDPFALPYRVKDPSGLAPAYVLAADHDPLLDEAVDYAARLRAAGVPTILRVPAGTIHGLLRARQYSELARQEFSAMCAFIRDSLAETGASVPLIQVMAVDRQWLMVGELHSRERAMLKKLGYAVVLWAVPYVTAIPLMPLMQSDPVFFKTIMVVEGAIVGTTLTCLYFRGVQAHFLKEGILLAVIWIVVNWLLDVVALLPFSKMPLERYFLEIGLRYVAIAAPTVAAGFALAQQEGARRRQSIG